MKLKLYKVLFYSLKLSFFIVVGYILLIVTYQICQGPDRCLDAGDNYVIGDLPGHLYYWPRGKPRSMIGLLDEKVEGFWVSGTWVVGKTKNYWFAVNKDSHDIYYPLISETDVKNISGLDFSSTDLMTKFPSLSFWWPSSYEYKFETTSIFGFLGIVGVGYIIAIIVVFILCSAWKRRNKSSVHIYLRILNQCGRRY